MLDFTSACELYLRRAEEKASFSAQTLRAMRADIRVLVAQAEQDGFGQLRPTAQSASALGHLCMDCAGQAARPATSARRLYSYKNLTSFWTSEGLIPYDPLISVRRREVRPDSGTEKLRVDLPDDAAIARLLAAAAGNLAAGQWSDYMLLAMLLSGLRVSELIEVVWRAVSWAPGAPPYFSLPDRQALLSARADRSAFDQAMRYAPPDRDARIFALSRSGVIYRLHHLAAQAGGAEVRPGDFRWLALLDMLRAGFAPSVITSMLGISYEYLVRLTPALERTLQSR